MDAQYRYSQLLAKILSFFFFNWSVLVYIYLIVHAYFHIFLSANAQLKFIFYIQFNNIVNLSQNIFSYCTLQLLVAFKIIDFSF